MRTMRPRGESISSPHTTYVGQVGRQKPQWMQVLISAGSNGSDASHEQAGRADAGRVEAFLDLAHQLDGPRLPAPRIEQRPHSAGASSTTHGAGASRRRRSSHQLRPPIRSAVGPRCPSTAAIG